ncbi:tyrosine-type recombinase/integrase [Verrucomicrobia bacterium]|nr:tyrosine-type recombinase/integrase [Verrucomicrobiota bacterium]
MASVHKRPRSRYFQAAFRDHQGRLIMRSTKVTDRAKALTITLEWERLAKNADELVEAQALKVISGLMERVGSEPIRTPTARDFLREWIRGKELHRSESTATRYAGVVERFLNHLGRKATRPLTSVAPKDVQSFLELRLEEGCAPSTISIDGKALRGAFNHAVKQGLLPNNPADAVELPARNSVKRGTFTPAEIGILLETAQGEWKDLILIAYYTGARLSDCTRMKWADVDLAGGTLTYAVKKKGGAEQQIPLHEHLEAHLVSLTSQDEPTEYIMPDMARKGPGGRHGLSEGFKRIMRKAGLALQTVQGGGKRKLARRTFHSLRHSFTSALANAGVPEELRMKLTGHSSKDVHRGYTHHELATLRQAIGRIPSVNES